MNRIKRFAINKFVISSLCLFLLMLFYFFPSHENFNTEVIKTNTSSKKDVVYLLDKDNYLSKVNVYFDYNNIEEEIKNKIDILINGCVDLENFYGLIPKKTELKSVKIDKNKVYLDFSKEFLNTNKYLEEQMIESIIYSLTEINGINEVYISVENKELNHLPISNKEIDYPLTRKYGINKKYDIDSFNNINKTTIVFSKIMDDLKYYVPVTKIQNSNEDKINIIINELKSSFNSQNNLYSDLKEEIELVNFNIENKSMNLIFNKKIDEASKLLITESVYENYDVNEINFDFINKS